MSVHLIINIAKKLKNIAKCSDAIAIINKKAIIAKRKREFFAI